MSKTSLIIVESPTKAKTIKKFLGKECIVIACMGHIRDLPGTAAEIPAELKKEKWSRLGINVEDGFKPLYVIPAKKQKTLTEIRKALKNADTLYLATDEDREGESISWHLLEVLKSKLPTKRMVFHEITAKAIKEAFDHPRELDEKLVRAQEARRILDRLVGYTVSPLIWKKIAFGLSAGRVQSVALKALVDLEKERMVFVSGRYWGIETSLAKPTALKEKFSAKLTHLAGKRIAIGKDFDEKTGRLLEKEGKTSVHLLTAEEAQIILPHLEKSPFTVKEIEERPLSQKPAPPFITSTLQQDANRKLGLSARETMRIAQGLYERGFITYMRTDSVNLSESAIQSSRSLVQKLYGKEYLSPEARRFTTKAKGAQEAHEAIRPSLDFTPPQEMGLAGRDLDIYEMIWMRTIATQMADAKKMQMSVDLAVETPNGLAGFTATGMKILFPGYLRAYVEGTDDPEQALQEKERALPDLKVGEKTQCLEREITEHETKPPSRYSEAGLIQFLEKEGIGRPSTYASIVSTILDRGYAIKNGNALVPTFTGFVVTDLLSKHFANLVDTKFTSQMEEKLDEIAEGKLEYLPYLKSFYLGKNGLQQQVADEDKKIDPEQARSLHFSHLKNLNIFVGKFGPYFEYIEPTTGEITKASLPNTLAPSDLNDISVQTLVDQVKRGSESLGKDPVTQLPIFVKTGSYGPYVQLGDLPADKKEKLKRVSIPKGIDPATLDIETALKILSLPRLVGLHPETGKEIRASVGRFGPYVVHEKDFRSLKKDDNVLAVDLTRAMELFSAPKGSRGRRSEPLRVIGEHPTLKGPIEVMKGPYGIYLKHDKTNVTVPQDKDQEKLTLEEAVALLATKAPTGKGGSKKAKSTKAQKKEPTASEKAPSAKKASGTKKKKTEASKPEFKAKPVKKSKTKTLAIKNL